MATVDAVDAFLLLQVMAPMSYDSSRLVDVACIAYAHVSPESIHQLRSLYLPAVRNQFEVRQPAAYLFGNSLEVHAPFGCSSCPESGCIPS